MIEPLPSEWIKQHNEDRDLRRQPYDPPEPDHGLMPPPPPPDDPRWDWINVGTLAEPYVWAKGQCHHLTPAPVDLKTGQLVAWWCPDCGRQFDAERWPVPDGMWLPLPEVDRSEVAPVSFDLVDTYADPRLIGDELAAIDRAHATGATVTLPDGWSYTPVWENPMLTKDGWPKPWYVRSAITVRRAVQRSARFVWDVIVSGFMVIHNVLTVWWPILIVAGWYAAQVAVQIKWDGAP